MGSGLVNCIKMPVEGFGESRKLSRTRFETGDGVAESGDIAFESLGKLRERARASFGCKPGDQRPRFGRPSRPTGGEQFLFGEFVAGTNVGHQLLNRGRLGRAALGLENLLDEILLADDPGIRFAAIERFVVPLGLAVGDEAGVAGAGNSKAGAKLSERPIGGEPRQVLPAQVGAVAAVGVGARLFHHAGAHRVEMDIANQRKALGVPVDEVGFEAALEDVSGAFQAGVEIAGVAKAEILQGGGQRFDPRPGARGARGSS